MTRYPDWPARLERFLLEHDDRPFRYGTWDCGLFVAGAIRAMTGTDPAADVRGLYASRFELLDLIRSFTGAARLSGMVETIATRVGMPEIPASSACRGDVLLLRRSRGHSLALMALDGHSALVLGWRGIRRISEPAIARAWRV